MPFSSNSSLLSRYAWLSLAGAVVTLFIKAAAWWLTGSVGLFSDALESLINVASGCFAIITLRIASKPPDALHPHGHDKVEYFFSGIEGTMIFVAAISIGIAAVHRILHPQPLEQISLALILSSAAALINLMIGLLLLKAGRHYHSITLESNAQHLMTDVWTSVGVIISIALVHWTGWKLLDPLVALVVAIHIFWIGLELIRRSVGGLMDEALPAEQEAAIRSVLEPYLAQGIHYHALRTRRAGQRCFISLHLLVPGAWSVQQGHDLADLIEQKISDVVKNASVLTHLEPLEDQRSWEDLELKPSSGTTERENS